MKTIPPNPLFCLRKDMDGLKKENARLTTWVNDLQGGMYINCVYCGHRYGPKDKVPTTMANVLKEHIEKCPKHPMSALKQENARLKDKLDEVKAIVMNTNLSYEEIEAKLYELLDTPAKEEPDGRARD